MDGYFIKTSNNGLYDQRLRKLLKDYYEDWTMNVLVFGGSGGIGLALTRHVLNTFRDSHVIATYCHSAPSFTHSRLTWQRVNVTNEEELQTLSKDYPKLDWIINCIGLLHDEQHGPEKSLASVSPEWFLHTMSINTLPTLLIAKHFSSNLKRSDQPRMAVLSARVGSIRDNRLGGWYSYRSSKAALNMLIKDISIEWHRTMPKASIIALHPGTTDTQLSEPFQANVPDGKLFTPAYVAQCLFELIQTLSPEQSGSFVAYDGTPIPW